MLNAYENWEAHYGENQKLCRFYENKFKLHLTDSLHTNDIVSQ